MAQDKAFSTDQEAFWAGEFGEDYISRNRSDELLASNLSFFARALRHAAGIKSCVELGPNIGMNLRAIKLLYPGIEMCGIEINETAAKQLGEAIGPSNVVNSSIFEWNPSRSYDLSFIKGVLIHLNPDRLPEAYERLYNSSRRYILVSEYYNPTPIAIPYRGHDDRLFKRDFAGDMLDRYADLELIDYGFNYHRDPSFPQGDITWFLLRKKAA